MSDGIVWIETPTCGCGWRGIPLKDRETMDDPVLAHRCPICKAALPGEDERPQA